MGSLHATRYTHTHTHTHTCLSDIHDSMPSHSMLLRHAWWLACLLLASLLRMHMCIVHACAYACVCVCMSVSLSQDMLQMQNKQMENSIRRELASTTAAVNLRMAEEKRLKALADKAAELAANLAEIDASLNSPLLTEDPNAAAYTLSGYRCVDATCMGHGMGRTGCIGHCMQLRSRSVGSKAHRALHAAATRVGGVDRAYGWAQ